MALLLSDLVARPELHLSVVAGEEHLDRPVHAAHASELIRPGGWLRGGELLMTIGLLLPMSGAACRAYVEDVAAGGAGALALGLGAELPYQEAPGPLRDAAAAAGIPLLTVGERTPFIAVTKAVFAAQAAEQRAAVEAAFETHRRLTAAAASGQGLGPTLDAWARATGCRAHVTDPLGRVIAADGTGAGAAEGTRNGAGNGTEGEAGEGARELPSGSAELIERVVVGGIRSSAVAPGIEVQPLGARKLRGILVLAGPVDADARLLVSGLVSLLSLELERRHLAGEPERRHRATLLDRLLEAGSAAAAGDVLTSVGLAATTVRAVACEPSADQGERAADERAPRERASDERAPDERAPGDRAAELAADLALAVPGGLIRTREGLVEAVVGEDLDIHRVLAHFAPGCPAGIGAPVPPEAAGSSLREAAGLLGVSRGLGRPVEATQRGSSHLLLGLGDRAALTGYADALLGPLEAADASGGLVRTLATWLDTGCSWDETGRRLGLHRHTVRNRLDKVMRLTGRRLDNGDDRFDLWLAVRARRAAGQSTDR